MSRKSKEKARKHKIAFLNCLSNFKHWSEIMCECKDIAAVLAIMGASEYSIRLALLEHLLPNGIPQAIREDVLGYWEGKEKRECRDPFILPIV